MNTEILTMDELLNVMQKIVDKTMVRNKKDYEYDKNWLECRYMNNDHVFFIWVVREGGTHIKNFHFGGGPDYWEDLKDIPHTGTEKFYYVTSCGSRVDVNTISELTREQTERKINTFIDFLQIQ